MVNVYPDGDYALFDISVFEKEKMMAEKLDHELLVEMHQKIIGIEQVLKGYNGDGDTGLCKQVENNSKAITRLWIALAVVIATSGGSSYAIAQKIMGG